MLTLFIQSKKKDYFLHFLCARLGIQSKDSTTLFTNVGQFFQDNIAYYLKIVQIKQEIIDFCQFQYNLAINRYEQQKTGEAAKQQQLKETRQDRIVIMYIIKGKKETVSLEI